MRGATLPGNSTVEMKDMEIPKPGHGQVLIQTTATTICGSDIRCIYREHVGKGPEGYIPGMVAGHEDVYKRQGQYVAGRICRCGRGRACHTECYARSAGEGD